MKRLTLLITLVGLVFGTLNSVAALPPLNSRYPDSASSLQASGYFYRFTLPPPTLLCSTYNYFSDPAAIFSPLPVDWNLPAGASIDEYEIETDGSQIYQDTMTSLPAGIGNGTRSDLTLFVYYAFPFSGGWRMDTVVGGQVVYRSIMTFHCEDDNSIETSVISNEVVNEVVSKAASCPSLPDGAVVGAMPLGGQAFYAPGKVTNITINPGTYWVIGEDESGQYYEILLACQYLWVPIDTMQPSYQPPWSGEPLPTRVVS